MLTRLAQSIMLFSIFAFLANISNGQWYQGPSGDSGGEPFDYWKASNGDMKIDSVNIMVFDTPFPDNRTVLCMSVRYKNGFVQKSGTQCDNVITPLFIWHGFKLDLNEHIIGVAGRFNGPVIKSLRFYTTKRDFSFGGGLSTTDFGYTAPTGHRIVGLFGRASTDKGINAIGVLYAPFPGNPRIESVRPGN